MSAATWAQQEQQDGSQDQKPKPVYASQDADKPSYSQDRPSPNGRSGRNAPMPSPARRAPQAGQPDEADQAADAARAGQPIPETLTIPAGTIVMVRINEFLSSDRNQVGTSSRRSWNSRS